MRARMVRTDAVPSAGPGRDVCTAFYGHPGIFLYPGHEAVRRTRNSGLRGAPGISALDADVCRVTDADVLRKADRAT